MNEKFYRNALRNEENLKCSCDICHGHATVIDLYNYNPLQIRICRKKILKRIDTQYNYTNFPIYSNADLDLKELNFKSIILLVFNIVVICKLQTANTVC